jgi:hypothetical protein
LFYLPVYAEPVNSFFRCFSTASALDDPVMANVRSIVLSYTFFRTGDAEVLGLADEVRKQQGSSFLAPEASADDGTREKIRQWAEGMAQITGVALPNVDNSAGIVTPVTTANIPDIPTSR